MTREEAIKQLQGMVVGADWLSKYMVEALDIAIEALQEPERKKGKWTNCGIIYAGTNGYTVFKCSECNEPNYRATRFCPNCGVKMGDD